MCNCDRFTQFVLWLAAIQICAAFQVLVIPAIAQSSGAVIATDYISAANVARLSLASPWTVDPDLEPVHYDARGRWHEGLLYIVNRGGADNIQVLDPEQDFATARQFSLGLGRNLQDIAFIDDGTCYVSCYDTAELLHIDPNSGTILNVVSTEQYADPDGLPETSYLRLHAGHLFLTCERLDRNNWYAPVGDSYLAVLDPATRNWIDCDLETSGTQGILLAAPNPYSDIVVADEYFLVGCTGFYALLDGGIDVVDPVGLTSLGMEISESDLGGDVVDLDLGPDGSRHVVVSDVNFVTSVVTYQVGGLVELIHQGVAYDHVDIAVGGDALIFVADRQIGNAGIRVFDALSGVQLTTSPIATGLPPALILLPSDTLSPVVELPGAGLILAAPWPNPANPQTTLAFTAPAGSAVELRIIDLRGRLVRRARVVTGSDGRGTWGFDGRDGVGHDVASGVYRCVAEGAGGFAARSLTLVR